MKFDMKSLGDMLKKKREEMSLSLKEVENATSIRMIYLQAIERGEIASHLSAVYALGFIKQYSTFLGYDGEKIIKENPKVFNMRKDLAQEFDYGLGTIDVRNTSEKSKKSNILWMTGAVFLLIAAWFFAKTLGVI